MPVADASKTHPTEVDLQELLASQRLAARGAGIPSLETRRDALDKLAEAVIARKESICDAADADFGGRSRHETLVAEIFTSVAALRHARDNLRRWMRPQRRQVGVVFQPARARVLPQPLGVVGILSPWNYPLYLALAPLAAVLAAGNRAMIKPSPFTPRIGDLLAEIVADLFPAEYVTVVNGGPELGPVFSALPFDHVMFTGSPAVGRQVMAAAAANHASVTLELGGKSPAIFADDCALSRAVPSLLTGKLFNAGQTCVAPDYLCVPEARVAEVVELARRTVGKMYPRLGDNPDYTAVIDDRHYQRLQRYVDDARSKGAQVIELNPANEPQQALGRKLPPTLLLDVTDEMLVMQEEIFGPLLPLRPYRDLRDVLDYVNDHPRPLTLYLFTEDDALAERVIAGTMSGGVCINDTLVHVAQEDLPFGGVGMSGVGQYHGYEGFLEFSKLRPIFEQSRLSTIPLLRAPYGRMADAILALLTRK